MVWAKKRLKASDVARIQEIDKLYRQTANRTGLANFKEWDEDDLNRALAQQAVRNNQLGLTPLQEALLEDE